MSSAERALVAAQNDCEQAKAELVAAQIPIKTMLDLRATLESVGNELRAEGGIADRKLASVVALETERQRQRHNERLLRDRGA